MNSTQVILLLTPVVLGYIYFVLTAKSEGRVNRRANLFSGLIVVPLFLGFLPFILLGVSLDLLRKRKWGEGTITLIFLTLLAGCGALIIYLRDPPPPSPWNLQVEQGEGTPVKSPKKQPVDPVEQPVERSVEPPRE